MKTTVTLIALALAMPAHAQVVVEAHAAPRIQVCQPGEGITNAPSGSEVAIVCHPPMTLHGHGKGDHGYVGLYFDGAACEPWLLWYDADPGANELNGYVFIYCQIDGEGKP
jgi:hypothetical protein